MKRSEVYEQILQQIKDKLATLEDVYNSGFTQEQEYNERKNELILSLHKLDPVAFPKPDSIQTVESSIIYHNEHPEISLTSAEIKTAILEDVLVQRNQPPARKAENIPRPFVPISSFVTSTSLVIMPPPDQWKQIVDIKKNHMNPRIKRPPYPHITLLQPFVDSTYFDIAAEDLSKFLQQVEPFHLNFDKFEIFHNRGSATLFLNPIIEPPHALNNLYKLLAERYPEVNKAGNSKSSSFEPHIGVGYFKSYQEAKSYQTKYQKDWIPISFTVQEIYIMNRKRQDTPFECRKIIPISQTPQKPHFVEIPL